MRKVPVYLIPNRGHRWRAVRHDANNLSCEHDVVMFWLGGVHNLFRGEGRDRVSRGDGGDRVSEVKRDFEWGKSRALGIQA